MAKARAILLNSVFGVDPGAWPSYFDTVCYRRLAHADMVINGLGPLIVKMEACDCARRRPQEVNLDPDDVRELEGFIAKRRRLQHHRNTTLSKK